jgi:glucose-6-phosphate isomerase
MSVIRPKPPEDPLRYDPSAAFATGAISRQAVAGLADRLEAVRREVLGDADRGPATGGAAADVAFLGLPDRLLADYSTTRPQSELFAILREARRVREAVDRVVVIGGAGIDGTRAIVEACCHPFHNELGRGERGGRPRLSFAAGDLDNDVAQGLLDLVAPHGRPRGDDLLDRWALVVVEERGGVETTATPVFLAALRDAVGGDERLLAERVVPIRVASGLVAEPVVRSGRPAAFAIPTGLGGGSAVFTAVGLLPASIAGCDVVRLLEGAAAMNRRFREAPVADNPVLQFAAVSRVATAGSGIAARGLASKSRQLAAVGWWHDRLRAATAGTVGAGGGAVLTGLMVGECRRDRLVPPSPGPDAAREERAGGATAEILLPRLDEHAVGQLLQMLMLATAIEDRLGGP